MNTIQITPRPLPAYKCHKIVHAMQIKEVVKHAHHDPSHSDEAFEASENFEGAHLVPVDDQYPMLQVDAAWYRKHNPQAGGYYVVYEDGYASYSPQKAFEDGYNPIVDNSSPSYMYPETEQQAKSRLNNFTYHSPKPDQPIRYQAIRDMAGELAKLLNEQCPVSRELSLAMTNLEQSVFWANAAIARNE